MAGQRDERVLKAGLLDAELPGHDLVAGQDGVTAFSTSPVPVTTHDIAPVDDAGDLGQAGQQPVVERDRRAELDALLDARPAAASAGGRVDGHDPARVDQRTRSQSRSASSMKWVTSTIVTPRSRMLLDQRPDVPPGLRVKAGGELVEHRDPRAADQGQRDRQPLLLAAGQLPELGVGACRSARAMSHQRPQSAGCR